MFNKFIEIADTFSTPLYFYDMKNVKLRYKKLRTILPDNFDLYYSMKSNPLLYMCKYVKDLGAKVEVASGGELTSALAVGFKPEDIIFTSPGKTEDELKYAIEKNIYSINVESIEEIKKISQLVSSSKTVNIAVRINPDFSAGTAGIMMSGIPTQFGVDQKDIYSALDVINSYKNLRLVGFHVYLGTQILDPNTLIKATKAIIELVLQIMQNGINELSFIDIGGGFGIPYFENEQELEENVLIHGYRQLMDEYGSYFNNVKFAAESGRYLVADSGYFLTKVLYRKECKGKVFIICDGGSNQHANSAFLGRFIRNNFPIKVIKRNGKSEEVDIEKVTVTGPLCTTTDVIAQDVNIAKAEPGDLIIIEKSGAYGLTNSPVNFLSHPNAAEVIFDNNNYQIARPKGKWSDFSDKQLF